MAQLSLSTQQTNISAKQTTPRRKSFDAAIAALLAGLITSCSNSEDAGQAASVGTEVTATNLATTTPPGLAATSSPPSALATEPGTVALPPAGPGTTAPAGLGTTAPGTATPTGTSTAAPAANPGQSTAGSGGTGGENNESEVSSEGDEMSSVGGDPSGGTPTSGEGAGAETAAGGGGAADGTAAPPEPESAGGPTESSGCGLPDVPESGRASLSVEGTEREYILRLPDDYDAALPHKLIFAFHARGGNASQVAGGGNDDYYGLFSRAGNSAVFVSPEGLDAGWRNTEGRDIAFVRAMLEEFSAKLCVDPQRIFSVGFSFGGMMSDAIGCAMADVFRAIAPMAGAVPNPEHPYSGCDQLNDHPVAVWMAHGDNDTVVPIADGMDALNIFLERAQCQAETLPVEPSPCVAYQGCLADYPIHLCTFSGGHQVPSFAADALWSFFDQF